MNASFGVAEIYIRSQMSLQKRCSSDFILLNALYLSEANMIHVTYELDLLNKFN